MLLRTQRCNVSAHLSFFPLQFCHLAVTVPGGGHGNSGWYAFREVFRSLISDAFARAVMALLQSPDALLSFLTSRPVQCSVLCSQHWLFLGCKRGLVEYPLETKRSAAWCFSVGVFSFADLPGFSASRGDSIFRRQAFGYRLRFFR